MAKAILFSTILLGVLLLPGCWKKQNHEITAPEIPVYTVSGTTLDRDSGEIMKDIVVSLLPVELMYDYDFTGAVDTTDENGYFELHEITPGSYTIVCVREAYAVVEEQIVVEHKDKSLEIRLPKPLLARVSYGPPDWPGFHGICWKDAQTFAGAGVWKENADDLPQNTVAVGNFETGFAKLGRSKYTMSNPGFYALAYLGRFWTTNGSESQTKLYSIDPARGNVDGETQVEFGLRDITADKTNLWATTSLSKIIKFGEHPSVVSQTFDVEAQQPYGIAWSETGLWITDFEENLVLRLDPEMKVVESYRPFGWNEKTGVYPLANLRYLTFDFAGNLWANDGVMVYKFTLK